jgi:hypothetical protein
MCDNCSSDKEMGEFIASLDERETALVAVSTIGALIEHYCEDGYCDPSMYKALTIGEMIANKFDERELAERFTLIKIVAGEVINNLIEENEHLSGAKDWDK